MVTKCFALFESVRETDEWIFGKSSSQVCSFVGMHLLCHCRDLDELLSTLMHFRPMTWRSLSVNDADRHYHAWAPRVLIGQTTITLLIQTSYIFPSLSDAFVVVSRGKRGFLDGTSHESVNNCDRWSFEETLHVRSGESSTNLEEMNVTDLRISKIRSVSFILKCGYVY
jgi:hypothetical protein